MNDIQAALEHARLTRTHLQDARKVRETWKAQEMAIELVEELERLARGQSS